jgi:lipid II:glycine glycyltransferase (peptidoglycan interpeptide bridge formation enzyme)
VETYTVKTFGSDQPESFNKFVASSPYANPLQSWDWGEIKTSKSWEAIRLGLYDGKKLVGIAQVLRRKIGFGFFLYYIPYGPLLDWTNADVVQKALSALQEYFKHESSSKALFVKIEPTINYSDKLVATFKDTGWKKTSKSIQPQYTAVVDLTPVSEQIFESFEKDTRYSIRRAEREEVIAKVFTNPLNNHPVKEFYGLYKTTSERGQFPARPFAQFEKIWEIMAPLNRIMIVEAWFKDKLLAAAFILKIGKKGFLVYAGSLRDDLVKNKFPTYLVQWKAMETLKKEGILSYDLWGLAPDNNPKHSWAGHTLFKRGFRGKEIQYVGSFDYPLSPLYRIYRTIDALRTALIKLSRSKRK